MTTQITQLESECILRLPDVMTRTGLKRSTIYLRIIAGSLEQVHRHL